MLTVKGPTTTVRGVMTRLLDVHSHPRYENVVVETFFSDEEDTVHRRYQFTYRKDAVASWIPSFLVPSGFLRVQNDSDFHFDQGIVAFCVQPVGNTCYRVEGRVELLPLRVDQGSGVEIRVSIKTVEVSPWVPTWIQSRLHAFIVHQVMEDLQSMLAD